MNDDFALHLEFADILALGDSAPANVDIAYPVGPHSVVAAISDALGVSIESAFVGVIIAVPVLTALTALAALEHAPRRAQPLGAALVGLSYLSAAFFIQASFKETVIASLVLTFTLVMREVARDRFLWRRWVVPIIALVFAGLAAFSVPALFWFVGIAVAVTVVIMVTERIRPDSRIALGALGLVVALAATIAIFETLTSFFSSARAGTCSRPARAARRRVRRVRRGEPVRAAVVLRGAGHLAELRFPPRAGPRRLGAPGGVRVPGDRGRPRPHRRQAGMGAPHGHGVHGRSPTCWSRSSASPTTPRRRWSSPPR